MNTIYPNVIPKLVKELKKKKVKERHVKMKKFVLVRKKFAKTLKTFESKRSTEVEKVGRFIGMMQEDRKKVLKKRDKYQKVDFDFNLDQIVKKKKLE